MEQRIINGNSNGQLARSEEWHPVGNDGYVLLACSVLVYEAMLDA